MSKQEKIIEDLTYAIVMLKDQQQQSIVELIKYLHTFNEINNRTIDGISQCFNVDAEAICREQGITYNII